MTPQPSSINSISLHNFRSYEDATLASIAGSVVLTGPNGAGKTNLLEAVSLFAPGRGMRSASLAEMVNDSSGKRDFAISINMSAADTDTQIGTGVAAASPGKRSVRVNGVAAMIADFPSYMSVLWLTPAQDRIFMEGASDRRRFFDRLVLGLFPDHAGHVARYEHAMRERMKLLTSDGTIDPAWLSALEARVAEHGVAAAAARRETALALQPLIDAQTDGLSAFPRAALAVLGDFENLLAKGLPALAVEDVARGALASRRTNDASTGRASYGPGRTDVHVTHCGKGQSADRCSTGEQKALLVAIILAHAQLIASRLKRMPIILLDEIAAHLDADRRHALFEIIMHLGVQAWMTGTDRSLFSGLDGMASFIRVNNAQFNVE